MIARQIADALEAAYDRGVIHRDRKPGNINGLETPPVRGDEFGPTLSGDDKQALIAFLKTL